MIQNTLEEWQSRLTDLRQAVDIEKRHRYINVHGRRKAFAEFMVDTLVALAKLAPMDGDGWQGLVQKFRMYGVMDVPGRMTTLMQLEETLNQTIQSLFTVQGGDAESASDGDGSVAKQQMKFLKGVGPKMAKLMESVGVVTVEDLLHYYPRRYLDYNNRVKIIQLLEGQEVTIVGTVRSVTAFTPPNRKISVLTLMIADETGVAVVTKFLGKAHQAVLETFKQRYAKGTDVMVSGRVKWDSYKRKPAIDNAQIEVLSYQDDEQSTSTLHAGRIVPIYPLTEGLSLRFLRKAIHLALDEYVNAIPDAVPQHIRERYSLMDLVQALRQIHFPDSKQDHEQARCRLAFDELFAVQIRLAWLRQHFKTENQGLQMQRLASSYTDRLLDALPYRLTGAQQRVLAEICDDLASPEPMYRLLQGDVGSGKTIVAMLTLLVGVEHGYQGAMMVPTEILAEQHYRQFVECLTPLGLKVGLLLGKTPAGERRTTLQGLLNGQIHIVIGTHALIQDEVEFANLGIIVVDEQHRFGVRQRTSLKAKGTNPEMLTMTATPIPRTLAMTVHGDLDVSILDELPPGRKPIQTMVLRNSQRQQAYQLIRQEVIQGRQVYIIFPLIDESETLAVKAATSEYESLRREIFPEYKIGLLHGKMKAPEKDAVMAEFVAGRLDILVSTTVVEVGVNVPNATVMMIENADRFGLAQLHQLRGRVGRGEHQSLCLLMCDGKGEETMNRLKIMEDSEDGFVIAEKDMELRGPGEFLGTRQSGLPDFVLANLVEDKELLIQARQAAFDLIAEPEALQKYPGLKALIEKKTDALFQVLGSG